jgi:Zn-dependent peptidase ImmA (M78 family)/DNA-binding XRE family transcriptional regulator
MTISEAFVRINGEVLSWARERLEATTPEAAAIVGFSEEQLEMWESGTGEPSYSQALTLARKLQIPFGYLFLSAKPSRPLPIRDLRTVQGSPPRLPSNGLLMVVEDAVRKQHWYSETLREDGASPYDYVGRFNLQSAVKTIAADIREVLELDEEMRTSSAPTVAAFMTELVRSSERVGVMVLRSGTVCGNTRKPLNVKEFRGFALPDPYAPIIFINSKDAMVAQIFTWAHEIAHIWIGAGGVSLLDLSRKSKDQANQIERLCDQVAAEVLVPTAGFIHNWNKHATAESNLSNLRRRYRVSELVILRKAHDINLIDDVSFIEFLKRYYDKPLEAKLKKDDEKESGGNFYNSLYARNSSRFTATVAERFSSGSMLATEACGLLGISQGVLRRIVAAT